ncbi:hypothetical protein A9Q99_18130 [Gammaproteobacteria bacterium 45_16_T64]|nr:hypothetical protein A9Q99_18130 [Gammaproteobacteria bacterium 45_16_T64]
MTTQETITSTFTLATPPKEYNSLQNMLKIGLKALDIFPPFYVQSVLGPAYQWLPPYREYSEFTILNPWKPLTALEYIRDVTIPSLDRAPNKWARTFIPPLITDTFWRPSTYHQQMDPFDSETSFIREKWFFLNGIMTNESVAQINSGLISKMFRRPVTIINNSTNSLPLDLAQCVIGHEYKTDPVIDKPETMTEPAYTATVALIEAVIDPEVDKVVLICHSQGTIIAANVLRALGNALHALEKLEIDPNTKDLPELDVLDRLALEKLPDLSHIDVKDTGGILNYALNILKKLEVYTFANCAGDMTYLAYAENEGEGTQIGLPYIENIANKHDIVARIGVLSPYKGDTDDDLVIIDGPVFERQKDTTFMDTWGHLLNHNYLYAIDDYLNDSETTVDPFPSQADGDTTKPRLYGYFAGQRQGGYA